MIVVLDDFFNLMIESQRIRSTTANLQFSIFNLQLRKFVKLAQT